MEQILIARAPYRKEIAKLLIPLRAFNPSANAGTIVEQIHYHMDYYPGFLKNPRMEDIAPFFNAYYNISVTEKELVGDMQHFVIDIIAKSNSIPEFPYGEIIELGEIVFDRVSNAISFSTHANTSYVSVIAPSRIF